MEKEDLWYPDTSIFIDFFENRGENGNYAKEFFEKIIEKGNIILYSDLHVKEFKNFGYTKEELIEKFRFIKNNLRKIHIFRDEKELAKKLAYQKNIPKGDALHAILTRNNSAQLISRDEHFNKIKDIAIVKKPEEVLI